MWTKHLGHDWVVVVLFLIGLQGLTNSVNSVAQQANRQKNYGLKAANFAPKPKKTTPPAPFIQR